MTSDEKVVLLQEESEVPEVYRSLNFRSIQDPYSRHEEDDLASRYSTLRAENVDQMLSGGLERFYKKYNHLSNKINLQLPTPEVRFENLSFSVQVPLPSQGGGKSTVGSHLRRLLVPWQKPQTVQKEVLHPMTGIIKPGSMTLVLANPGAGKSTFLKALAGKVRNTSTTRVGGEILYSGLRADEIDLIKLVGLVDQNDTHIPTLTVRETFKFADLCMNGLPESQPEELRDIAALRTELFIQILGLNNCADTVVGDALLRGVSGGEKKRVTVGEMLVGGQSLFLCDEISTGLDSAATYDIIQSVRTWAKTLGGSAVIALLQPTPEVVELFDDILMINEGHLLYHGPRTEILSYFSERGFTCPSRTDPADFLIEITSGRGRRYANGNIDDKKLPVTSEEFSNLFYNSRIFKKTHETLGKGFNEHAFENAEDFRKAKAVANLARSKEKSEYGLSFFPSTMLLLNRSKMVWLRDRPLLWGKILEGLLVGLVLGMIFYECDPKYYLRMIFFSIAVFQRQAWQQVTIAFQLRKVFYKQRTRNFFRTSSYAIATSIVQIPVNLTVALVMGTFFYFMSGLVRTAEKFFVCLLIWVAFQHAIGAWMTLISSVSPSITVGQAAAGLSVSFFLLFSGNIILADLIPDYWIWMYWFNPLSWALRSIMLSEFSSDRYDANGLGSRQLRGFSITQGKEYLWYGFIILMLYYFLFTAFNAIALHFIRYEKFQGVTNKPNVAEEEDKENVYVEVSTPGAPLHDVKGDRSKGAGLAFIPANLCIKDLEYFVTLPSGEEKQLLRGILEGLLVGLVLGMIFYECDPKYYLRMIFFSIAVFQRQAWQQVTIAFQLRKVFYKQRTRNFFRTSSYAIATSIVQIPVNLTVALVMGTFFYFMSGLVRTAEKFFVCLLIWVAFQHAIGAWMTLISSVSPSITVGQAAAGLSVSFFLLFSGNIILADLIPDYWIWMYWFNPLSWALRSIMLSEFSSDRYDANGLGSRQLRGFSITQGKEYLWYGFIILMLYYFLFTAFNAIALHFIRYEKFQGVTNKPNVAEEEDKENVYVEVSTPGAPLHDVKGDRSKGAGLAFIPANLCIKDLEYFVTLPSGEEKQLLRGVTAHFEPGKMTALMGATGAGKTTLMDVIAGRKTGGSIVGEIVVNGEPKNPSNFSRIAAYCEQMDIHSEGASIYEALVFSASLRLPSEISEMDRMNLVNETLDLLELTGIRNELIANLSVEQKKRVTIGVEVVSNPSILFLDEPTSGLDARSAIVVMRGVQSIARTGRTVLCTIHQPSISIFELFDALLLLQRGGFTAYFGDLGKDSITMLEYFASIPGTEQIRPQYNPATYMLEVIGAGIGRDVKDYSLEYRNSELYKSNREHTMKLLNPPEEFVRFSTMNFRPIATSFTNQLSYLATKQRLTYWRSPQYNFVRLFLFPLFAIIFGTTFYQLGSDTTKKINSHIGLIYNSMDFIGVINLMTVIEISCAERAVYYRERMSNYYDALPFSLSLFFAELPYLVVAVSMFLTILYWLVGWNSEAGAFFYFLFVFFLYTSVCTFIGQWMSALTPNAKVANVAVGALSCLFNLFSGFLLPPTRMRSFYKWFKYLMPSSYSLAALVSIQFGECSDLVPDGCQMITVTSGNTNKTMSVESYVNGEYDFNPEYKYNNMIALIVFWVAVQALIFLTLKYVSHLKR
ncbi:hypothetical protein ABG067_006811 [Albugo candida]